LLKIQVRRTRRHCRTDGMKRAYPFLAIAAGLLIAASAGAVIASRSADAAAGKARFARPDYELARPADVIDLTRYGALADGPRLARLETDSQACHDALAAAGVSFTQLPAARASNGCGFGEAVLVQASLTEWRAPDALPMACDLAARMHMWERHVVIPAAEKYLGSPVTAIEAFGSFQCRSIAGHDRLSEHAFAKAADIAGFTLADGRRVSVLEDFHAKGAKGDFLREIRGRACDLFDVTLGPDFNADHANHFHLDVGGERACR
jgi:hypothetical protein